MTDHGAPVGQTGEHADLCMCGHFRVLHRIGDDACPIIDGDDLSFHTSKRFRLWTPSAPVAPSERTQCKKAPHDNLVGGYLHSEDDDTPYDVDGILYCGRCHSAWPHPAPAADAGRQDAEPPSDSLGQWSTSVPGPSERNADAELWLRGILIELTAAYYSEGMTESPNYSARQNMLAVKHSSEMFSKAHAAIAASLRTVPPREEPGSWEHDFAFRVMSDSMLDARSKERVMEHAALAQPRTVPPAAEPSEMRQWTEQERQILTETYDELFKPLASQPVAVAPAIAVAETAERERLDRELVAQWLFELATAGAPPWADLEEFVRRSWRSETNRMFAECAALAAPAPAQPEGI